PSLRLANRLAGNPETTPALEILHQGPTLEVAADSVRVAIAGGTAEIELLDDTPQALGGWRSLRLGRGDRFRIGRTGAAACCYLPVEGGFAVAPCLGSASTFARGGFGGFAGRALRAGDLLPLSRESAEERPELGLATPPATGQAEPIRVVLG